MAIDSEEFKRVTRKQLPATCTDKNPDLPLIIKKDKTTPSIENKFAPNIKESILRMEYSLNVMYSKKDYFYFSLFNGFRNYVTTKIQEAYKATAIKNADKSYKTDSNGYYIIVVPDTEIFRSVNSQILSVYNSYATLIQCADKTAQEDEFKNKVEKAYDQRREAMNKLRTDEISNIDKRFKDMGIDKNVFTDEDIINLYNNAYWARKGDVAQPLPSWYIPPQQQRYYYDGH